MPRAVLSIVVALLVGAGVAAIALGDTHADAQTSVTSDKELPTTTTRAPTTDKNGVQHLHYEFGPLDIKPGQNIIETAKYQIAQPQEDGWILGFKPNLQLPNGKIPPVDVLHLHHGVWAVYSRHDATYPIFPERVIPAGEEETELDLPAPYGYRYTAGTDVWYLNYMNHNL